MRVESAHRNRREIGGAILANGHANGAGPITIAIAGLKPKWRMLVAGQEEESLLHQRAVVSLWPVVNSDTGTHTS